MHGCDDDARSAIQYRNVYRTLYEFPLCHIMPELWIFLNSTREIWWPGKSESTTMFFEHGAPWRRCKKKTSGSIGGQQFSMLSFHNEGTNKGKANTFVNECSKNSGLIRTTVLYSFWISQALSNGSLNSVMFLKFKYNKKQVLFYKTANLFSGNNWKVVTIYTVR